ncbi:MAG: hypothetical protein UZ17_ACD001000748 [Acidobacteria bacterium OLB17]|nr:MAG: hypothetical protein UZ17_ACD001000748 [Acidobacteria bacterium OLB17]MCZ2389680.1 DUF937 domain-containing protein [Acidobacteriota bacterium]
MFSLEQLLGQDRAGEAVSQISQNVSAEPSLVNSAISMALPAILGGLANNASTPQGAESLNNALDRDHSSGGILGNLGGLANAVFGGGQQQAPPPEADGSGILGHILGNSQGALAQNVSQKTGLNVGQVAQILMMLAPIVMSYLGQKKQQENVGADGLGGLLGGILGGAGAGAAQGGGLAGMASAMLDSDHDGSALDDIASMAFNYIKNK